MPAAGTPSPLMSIDRALRGGAGEMRVGTLLAMLVVFGLIYGAAMGTFTGLWDGRPLQLLYSALKVPILLLASFVVALPSFFALNTILGLRADFVQALRAVAGAQAVLTIVLASLGPVTVTFYAGSRNYELAVLFNGLMFLAAAAAAQVWLRRSYAPLIARDRRHRVMMWAWGASFAFVGIQAAWVLRPFIGHPDQPTQFFRDEMWGNAYVHILQLAANAFR